MLRHCVLGLVLLAACSRAERTTDSDARMKGDASSDNVDADLTDASVIDAPPVLIDAVIDAPPNATCGNGMPNSGEDCDDSNVSNNDGCSSTCTLEPTQIVTVMGLNQTVPDDAYNGTVATMACANVVVNAWYTPNIASMTVLVGADHNWTGDIVIKLVSPNNTTVTLVSRPGYMEAADDGNGGFGSSGVLNKSYPFTFATGASTSGESLGVGGGTVCQNISNCMFAPNNGAAAAGNLTAFNGMSSTGTWKLCMGDATSGDVGKIDRVTLTFNH